MAQRYIDITPEKLIALHDGLEMLEMLDREALGSLDLMLYGLTQNPTLIDAAKEAIADAAEFEIREEDVTLSEIAVAIPIGADILYKIDGSGFKITREEFAYMGKAGEGIRTLSFAFASYKPKVALSSFTTLAIASSDSWLDDFLKQYGNKQPVEINEQVRRTEEATQPGAPAAVAPPPAPAAPEAPQPPAPPAAPGLPKQTSLKIADLLENFLG